MLRRRRLSRKHSRRMFSKHARKIHKRNLHRFPVRGGFRI